MPSLVLKIDVDTFRGTREGVPNLARLLQRYEANASFLFSLGPDHTGRALRRVFRPGFFQKVSRTSVVEHYGIKTLMYGVLLPGPDIGKECASEIRAIRDAGFECGIHTWDHVLWQDNVRNAEREWTASLMRKAYDRFCDILGAPPETHGAAGWQMNEHAFAQLDEFGFAYASDGRCLLTPAGRLANDSAGPHRLRIGERTLSCVQLPTTLPTLDELLGCRVGQTVLDTENIADFLLGLTKSPRDHVYTLHAELEGQKLLPIFERLLKGWQAQGYDLISMQAYHRSLDLPTLPVRPLRWGELPGRSGELILDGG